MCAIIDNDPTIGKPTYRELKECCNLEGGDLTAAWLTKVLLCAMDPREVPAVVKALRMVSIDYIPSPCSWFQGRENEIEQIHDDLLEKKNVFLQGIPGVGKSELAKKYVAEYGKKYTEVLWIPCRKSLGQSIAAVEVERDRMEDDVDIRLRNHLHMIKHLPEGALVVLDNCNYLPEEEPLLEEILAYRCHMLVTTRTCVEGRYNLEVQELPEPELMELMKCFCRKKNYPDWDLKLLIQKLHRHTFAVELAARMVANKTPTPRELLLKLTWSRFARFVLDKKVSSHKDNATKRASYYQTMSDLFMLMKLDPDKQEVMRNMTLMPDEGVYRHILLMLLGLQDDEQVEELERMGLLRWDEETEVVQMLPLVRDIVLEDISPSIRKCNVLVDRVARLLSEYGADDPCLPLLYTIMERIVDEAEKDDLEQYWALLCNTFNAMEGIGQKSAMNRVLREMEVFGKENPLAASKTAEYLDMKACLAEEIKEKVILEENALRVLEKSGEGDSELAKNIRNNLAGAYRMANQHQKAIEMLEKRLKQIKKEERIPLRHNYLTCVCNLAVAYAETGERAKALDLMTPVEQELRELGEWGSEYAMALETLGHVYMLAGQLSPARENYDKALSIWIDLYGSQSNMVQEKISEYKQALRITALKVEFSGMIG